VLKKKKKKEIESVKWSNEKKRGWN